MVEGVGSQHSSVGDTVREGGPRTCSLISGKENIKLLLLPAH